MDIEAVGKQVLVGAETTDRVKDLPTDQDGNNASLPSPPSSEKATALDSDRNQDGLLSGDVAGDGSSACVHGGTNAADAVNDEPTSGKLPNDPENEETTSQDNREPDAKESDITVNTSYDPDEVDDRVSLRALLRQIQSDTLYPKTSEEQHPLRKRIKKGAKLAVQQMEYIRLMEDRMRYVEKRLRLIDNKGAEPEPPTPRPGETNQPTDFIMGIKRMTLQEYVPTDPNPGKTLPDVVQHKRRHEFPGQLPYHLIDVVVSGMNQPERLGKDQITKPAAGSLDPSAHGPTNTDHGPTVYDFSSVQPERIRINSTLLLRVLEKITTTRFSFSRVDNDYVLQDQVILRPFKLFVTFEQEIRDEIDRLEKIHMRQNSESKPSASKKAEHETQSLSIPQFSGDVSQNAPVDASVGEDGKETDSLESRRCLEELLVVRELLDKDLKRTFDLRKQIIDGSARNIEFQDLWHLFAIGKEIVSNGSNGQNQTYRILNAAGGRPFLCGRYDVGMEPLDPLSGGREVPKFEILSYFYDFDGIDFGACSQMHTIKSYDGKKAITSLPCFPVIYSKHYHGLKPQEFFIARGKRFLELTRKTEVVHKRYNGLTQAMDDIREEVDSEVIVDVNLAVLKNNLIVVFGVTQELGLDLRETLEYVDPRCTGEGCCQNTPIHRDDTIDSMRRGKMMENKGFMRAFIEPDSELTEEDYLVCPSWVYGYVLRSRKWVKLDVSLVEDIKESGSGFDSLVLPEGHKDTLLALVKTHSQGKTREVGLKVENRQMDLVRGKGKGLIILLHGEPGVGKSSTAESVAEFTRRPLFQVTCGDIGESADEVERRLENHFQLAHKWGCVLLLDEADVFLEARSKTDLKRNAIVSVFLRVLEYYSGILFLTTNRVGAFDQAFRSRIHMSLFYPRIEEDATLKIWEMNIDRAREIWGDKLSIDAPDRAGILKFAAKHYKELAVSETTWNGRQIRNAFQTAIALAEWDAYQSQLKFKSPVPLKPRLESEHFERVAKASKHFDAYLKETQVGTMADLAGERRERRDDFRGAEY